MCGLSFVELRLFPNPVSISLLSCQEGLRPIFLRPGYAIELFLEIFPYSNNVMNPVRHDFYLGSTGYLYVCSLTWAGSGKGTNMEVSNERLKIRITVNLQVYRKSKWSSCHLCSCRPCPKGIGKQEQNMIDKLPWITSKITPPWQRKGTIPVWAIFDYPLSEKLKKIPKVWNVEHGVRGVISLYVERYSGLSWLPFSSKKRCRIHAGIHFSPCRAYLSHISWSPQLPRWRFGGRSPVLWLSLIHIWRCRRYSLCRSRWSPDH